MTRDSFIKSATLGIGALSLGYFNHTPKGQRTFPLNKSIKEMVPKILKHDEGKMQIVLGDHQTVKLTGKDTNGLYTLIEQDNNPGTEIPLHIHRDEDEVFHVLEGELQLQIGKDIKTLHAGDIGFCPRGIPHSWKVVGTNKAKVMLSIFPSGLEDMFNEITNLPEGPPDFKKITTICNRYNIQFV